MRTLDQQRNRDRITSAIAVAVIHAMLGYVLLTGMGFEGAARMGEALKVFDVEPPPPPVEESVPADARNDNPEGAAAPPKLRAQATPVVAPTPRLLLETPPPIVAAPTPGVGGDPSAGASALPGPGTGAGGTGSGTGSGGAGGGGGGIAVRSEQIAGRIRASDYPRTAYRAKIEGTVLVVFTVTAKGRASGCAVRNSSGSAELDAATCRLIEQRYRFRPARDARGAPVPDVRAWEQRWWLEGR